ncbi:DoxX family protein [Sphingobium sp. WCS2017Hpa-17]|uniref:DoxX family protein n=1 Tax=Sphingobium sp. WCS2017Hpa-17 TaxID=3073638 RepID=UPI00288BD690|nr:DoxX family protein [Sphingobium sp. WCS2017Hpa-17]
MGVVLASCLLALFFLFVGYMKAFAPLAELMQHHAWTVYLPEPVGRTVGWSEMGCALLLLIGIARPAAARVGAVALLLNQMVAAAVHGWMGEAQSLPQNAVIVLICVLILALQSGRRIMETAHKEATSATLH